MAKCERKDEFLASDITGLNYSYDNANPMTISATMKFLDFEDATDTLLE